MAREVQISIIVPFKAKKKSGRAKNWNWLKQYLQAELPDAEIIQGRSKGKVFSKTQAVNNGVKRSHGRIIAVVDADCYIEGSVIQEAADKIDAALDRGQRRWFIPYRRLYRLTEPFTAAILRSDPTKPLRVSTPPRQWQVESTLGSMHGRRYGAMIQIMPREVFEIVGGMDERFRGWGGEDVSFARAVDTIYGKHKSIDTDINHLWHPKILAGSQYSRAWDNQKGSVNPNMNLTVKYNKAYGDVNQMRALVAEGNEYQKSQKWYRRTWSWIKGVFASVWAFFVNLTKD